MELLEIYDLTGSVPTTAQLCGVDPKTVRRAIAIRAAGGDPTSTTREKVTDSYIDKIVEWVERSQGLIRADKAHEKLVAMGYLGSQRTTRRIVSKLKKEFRYSHHRSYKPWIVEPGLWLQYDFGDGPRINGVKAVIFCAWLAWSRFRVIVPLQDKTLPSVIAALDQTYRILGGAPSYVLTDNEKTVTDKHIAGIAIRNPQMVSASLYYGVTIASCVAYDPESKGGSEATVKIAKADLVPSLYNLNDNYTSWADFELACRQTTNRFNARVHAITKKSPDEMIVVEREHLHLIPDEPYSVAFGLSRSVSWSSVVSFRGARYSVPHTYNGQKVWVRCHGDQVIIVANNESGKINELARHRLVDPGSQSIVDDHYPHARRNGPQRVPRATNSSEAAFLALGHGAHRWLIEAAACGARSIEKKMAQAVSICATYKADQVDEALGLAALEGRFAQDDLVSILNSRASAVRKADETSSLQPGTSRWEGFGQ